MPLNRGGRGRGDRGRGRGDRGRGRGRGSKAVLKKRLRIVKAGRAKERCGGREKMRVAWHCNQIQRGRRGMQRLCFREEG